MPRNYPQQQKYTVGSLFAGVGVICEAFKQAGCSISWANEIDPKSRKTYQLNHPDTPFTVVHDVAELSASVANPVDIITAGFPCQPFSHAGKARGFDDERGQLFFDVIRLINELRPQAIFLENVKSLATHRGGESFRRVAKEILGIGYSFIPFVLKSNEYSDVPQGRERIYIVGFRDESSFHYAQPIPSNYQKIKEAPLSSGFSLPDPTGRQPRPVTEFLEPSTADESDFYLKSENVIHQRVREAVVRPGVVYQYRRWFVRENKSNVCPTLTANMGMGGHNIPIVLDNGVPRRLSPKECFNLQGFSDFKLPNDVSRAHLYRQCGNSVVVPVVERIAAQIVEVLDAHPNRQACSR